MRFAGISITDPSFEHELSSRGLAEHGLQPGLRAAVGLPGAPDTAETVVNKSMSARSVVVRRTSRLDKKDRYICALAMINCSK